MSWYIGSNEYKTLYTSSKKYRIELCFYPVDGIRVTITKIKNGVEVCDVRIIADSLYETLTTALMEYLGMEWEQADWECAEWGIFMPDEEEEN